MTFRVGIDIGGTFTDFVVMSEAEVVLSWKEDSTPEDSLAAVRRGLAAISSQLGLRLEQFLRETTLLVHGTTAAMNMVLQRTGPRVGLLCTEGFRDILYFRNGFKPDRFNIHLPHPRPLVDRRLRVSVRERIDAKGNVVTPLDEAAVRRAADEFRLAGVEAVAVALLWSPVNRGHERRAAEILREELPEVPIIEAADVLPELREWERTSASVLSAYVLPGLTRYLRRFENELRGSGLRAPPLIMQTNGGCAAVEEILRRPVYSLASGPAAAPAAALHAAGDERRDLIAVDLGGTSFDVSLITNGGPDLTRSMEIEGQPLGVMGVAVHSVGAGGGSIAWVDSGGAIRVGPLSAGSRPGPACYDQGGTRATLTDAYVVLGYLEPSAFLGGRRLLRDDLALQAIDRHVAQPLELDPVRAAAGVKGVADSRMVRAIETVSVKRGIDPRRFTLVVGGGAGGLHAVSLARKLGIRRILVPCHASVFCALGMTVTDVRHDYARLLRTSLATADLDHLSALFAEMEEDGRSRLRDEGFSGAEIHLERSVDACYRGQLHDLTVPLPGVSALTEHDLEGAARAFHAKHQNLFRYHRTDVPVEFLHWRLVARGRVFRWARTAPSLHALPPGGRDVEPSDRRLVHFLEFGGWLLTDVFVGEEVRPGAVIEGPAVIQSPTNTLLLSPGDDATFRPDGSYLIRVAAGP